MRTIIIACLIIGAAAAAEHAPKAEPAPPAIVAECRADLSKIDAAQADLAKMQDAFVAKWAAAKHKLPALPVPDLPADPRQSDVARAQHIRDINGAVERWNITTANGDRQGIATMLGDRQFAALLAEYQAALTPKP